MSAGSGFAKRREVSLRRVRFSAATSLDGFIAGPNGEIDWIARDRDFDFTALYSQFDTALVGRKTFDEMNAKGGRLPGIDLYVFSYSASQKDCPNAKLSRDPVSTVSEIRAAPGKDIWLFGGARLFASLMELGLVDSVEISVSPVLLGEGLQLLPLRTKALKLELTSERVYPRTGMVRLDYSVKR